jgi:hypothetical protein
MSLIEPVPVWVNKIKDLSDREIIDLMQTNLTVNTVRFIMNSAAGRIEQAYQQRQKPSPIDVRRMEFEAANEICRLFGKELT